MKIKGTAERILWSHYSPLARNGAVFGLLMMRIVWRYEVIEWERHPNIKKVRYKADADLTEWVNKCANDEWKNWTMIDSRMLTSTRLRLGMGGIWAQNEDGDLVEMIEMISRSNDW